jgi:hypothetical protein
MSAREDTGRQVRVVVPLATRAVLLAGTLISALCVADGCSSSPPPGRGTPEPSGREAAGAIAPVGVLEGQVHDSSRTAIYGARVILFGNLDREERRFVEWWLFEGVCSLGAVEYIARKSAAVASTHTDADGRFKFSGLRDGAYTLRVTAPGVGFTEKDVSLGVPVVSGD